MSTKFEKFAEKINGQIAGLVAGGKWKATDFIIDPGKFGRLAASAPLAAKYTACKVMQEAISTNGRLTEGDVRRAFEAAGIK